MVAGLVPVVATKSGAALLRAVAYPPGEGGVACSDSDRSPAERPDRDRAGDGRAW